MDSSAANQKKKGKGMSVENILKKGTRSLTIIYCTRCVPVIENDISSNLYNGMFNKDREEKFTAFQSMARSFVVHKMLLKTLNNLLLWGKEQCLNF